MQRRSSKLQDCNPCDLPMDAWLKVGKNNDIDTMDATMYHNIIGIMR
jgi:hypothetical protein